MNFSWRRRYRNAFEKKGTHRSLVAKRKNAIIIVFEAIAQVKDISVSASVLERDGVADATSICPRSFKKSSSFDRNWKRHSSRCNLDKGQLSNSALHHYTFPTWMQQRIPSSSQTGKNFRHKSVVTLTTTWSLDVSLSSGKDPVSICLSCDSAKSVYSGSTMLNKDQIYLHAITHIIRTIMVPTTKLHHLSASKCT